MKFTQHLTAVVDSSAFYVDKQLKDKSEQGSLRNFLKIITSFTSIDLCYRLAESADCEGNCSDINVHTIQML